MDFAQLVNDFGKYRNVYVRWYHYVNCGCGYKIGMKLGTIKECVRCHTLYYIPLPRQGGKLCAFRLDPDLVAKYIEDEAT